MNVDVPIITGQPAFPEIAASAKLAIIMPTARWNPMVRSIIGSMIGVASDDVVVLIGDNSENNDKRLFLQRIREINPNIISITHKKNIGVLANFCYLYGWSKNVPFLAQMADDDWVSPDYHIDAYRALLANPMASCAEAGTAFVDLGDGNPVNASQQSMRGLTAIDRMVQWNGFVPRVTMYNVSRRESLDAAIQYVRTTPLTGTTLFEDLWELNRLAFGDFLHTTGPGCYVHYPALCARTGNTSQRIYESLYKEVGLQSSFVWFGELSTAIQCALFLMGKLSPIADPAQRAVCGQYVFAHIVINGFFPRILVAEFQAALPTLFSHSPIAMHGLLKYCNTAFQQQPVLDRALIDWFIEIIRLLETKSTTDARPLSECFRLFVDSLLL